MGVYNLPAPNNLLDFGLTGVNNVHFQDDHNSWKAKGEQSKYKSVLIFKYILCLNIIFVCFSNKFIKLGVLLSMWVTDLKNTEYLSV